MAPACPTEGQTKRTSQIRGPLLTVVAKVEAAVDPDAVFGDRHIVLGIDGPLPGHRHSRDLVVHGNKSGIEVTTGGKKERKNETMERGRRGSD